MPLGLLSVLASLGCHASLAMLAAASGKSLNRLRISVRCLLPEPPVDHLRIVRPLTRDDHAGPIRFWLPIGAEQLEGGQLLTQQRCENEHAMMQPLEPEIRLTMCGRHLTDRSAELALVDEKVCDG